MSPGAHPEATWAECGAERSFEVAAEDLRPRQKVQHSICDFLISTESAGPLVAGNIKCYHGLLQLRAIISSGSGNPLRDLPGDCAKCCGGFNINPCHRWS